MLPTFTFLQKDIWNFGRIKAVMIAKSRIVEWLNLDQTLAQQRYKQSLKRCAMARIIKQYGEDTCKDISNSTIAKIPLKFKVPNHYCNKRMVTQI